MKEVIRIGRHTIGPDYPAYFVADIAANHDGDLERAKDLIYLCAEAGANAAKFQNFKASTIASDYGFRQMGNQIAHQAAWKKSVFDVYKDAALPMEWTEILKATCDSAGIDYLTAPYDIDMVQLLSQHVCAWKVGSGDITWHEHIANMARDGKPLLIATGASEMEDVRLAMSVALRHTNQIVLMQCNTNYTASIENFHYIALNVLKTYEREFPNVVLGLSDHTTGHTTVLGAVALGARAIEKHFTDDTRRDGPDHKFSMDPKSWRTMVDATRELEAALGSHEKHIMANELETVVVQRRALRARRLIVAGTLVSKHDLIPLRPCPADSLPPYQEGDLIGRRATRDIEEGDCIRPGDVR
jgi:sialic acid synthase SpsE